MKIFKTLSSVVLLSLLLTGIGFSQENGRGDFLTRAIDKSVNPSVDFFKYATGTWMENNPIPPTEKAWGIGNLVQEETYARLKGILEEAEKTKSPKGSSEQKLGDFYFTGMDSVAIEKQGITPLKPELNKINSIKNKKELYDVVALLQREGVNAMFGLFVDQDQKNSDAWALYLWQGGLGLPNRDYYFRKDPRTEKIRSEYKKHAARIFELLGENKNGAVEDADAVYQIEVFLADSSRKLEDLRDTYANYNNENVMPKHYEACFIVGHLQRFPARTAF